MAGRQLNQPITLGQKESFTAYHECACPLADKGREGRLDLAGTTCIQNHHARAEDTCRILYGPFFSRGLGDVARIDEHRDRGGWRHQALHQLKAFFDQLHVEVCNPRDVAAGLCEARDETNFNRVGTHKKTIGTVSVTALAANAPGVLPPTTIMAT